MQAAPTLPNLCTRSALGLLERVTYIPLGAIRHPSFVAGLLALGLLFTKCAYVEVVQVNAHIEKVRRSKLTISGFTKK